MPLAPCPILTQWAQPCGKWRATYRDGTHRDFDSEDAAGHGWDCLAPLYRLADGREFISSELPPGSVRDVSHLWEGYPRGADGLSIIVVCPDNWHWSPDGRAANCTMKADNVHRCWCRHGDPRVPGGLHVDKVGLTCQAGAGSIQTGSWHGFLHHGYLVEHDGQIPRGPKTPSPVFISSPSLVEAKMNTAPLPPPPPRIRNPKQPGFGAWG